MPDMDELDAYAGQVNQILTNGAQIEAIQLYTIARPPMDTRGFDLSPLKDGQMDQITQMLQGAIDVPIEAYY
jgi:hypothetical protein